MHLLVAGVRQKTVPIQVREHFALPESRLPEALSCLGSLPGIAECAIVSTCNRTELYIATDNTRQALASVRRFFTQMNGTDMEAFRPWLFSLLHEDALIHLFRVASGLDSLILGEAQILAQVKDALQLAQQHKTNGYLIDRAFKGALTVGKRVRTETGIASKDLSVSRAAYELAKQSVPDFLNQPMALIGGGKMATLLMASLRQEMSPAQQAHVQIVNRSEARLKALCDKFGFMGVGWSQIEDVLSQARVLFVATGAPHVVLDCDDFAGKGPKWVFDISVPRNVDPAVGQLPGIQLLNTDDLAGAPRKQAEQEALVAQAQGIIEQETTGFMQWHQSLSVIPAITQLRQKMETIRQAETQSRASQLGPSFEEVDALTRTLVNKILHEPMTQLKTLPTDDALNWLSRLFKLDETLPSTGTTRPTSLALGDR